MQSILVISTSLISNNRLSRSENLIPDYKHENLTTSNKTLQKRGEIASKEQFLLFFTIVSNIYFGESLGLQDNESRLYTDSGQFNVRREGIKLIQVNLIQELEEVHCLR